jgi:hypothetical protein
MIDGPKLRVVAADLGWPEVEVVEHKPGGEVGLAARITLFNTGSAPLALRCFL